MSGSITIENGLLIDPASGIETTRDIFIQNGKISQDGDANSVSLDASGCVVMAGGVDIHTHIIGPMGALSREVAGDTGPTDHTLAQVNEKYSAMGYTTIVEPGVPPAHCLQAREIASTLDKLDVIILALLPPAIEKMTTGEMRSYIPKIVNDTKTHGVKMVNPSSMGIAAKVAKVVGELGLSHPLHLHLPHLGEGGNYLSTINAIEAVKGAEAHIAHMQFHCYGVDAGKLTCKAEEVARAINEHTNISIDLGQIVFGPTEVVSADADVIEKVVQGQSIKTFDAGDGIVIKAGRYEYKRESAVNATQWITGLMLALCVDDPWRIYLSTDHPNGGPFTAYPSIIKLLMDRNYRAQQLSQVNANAKDRAALESMDREYSLAEIAIITRAGPAKRLGLNAKGSLAVGASADVAVYRQSSDFEAMFTKTQWTIKDGVIVSQ